MEIFGTIAAADNIIQTVAWKAMQWMGIVMISVGLCTSCVAAFGCFAVVCQNRKFLYVYAIILKLIILLEFAGVVVVVLKFYDNLWHSYTSGFQDI